MKYNLTKEPWLRLLRMDGSIVDASLRDLFRYSHEMRGFAGESGTQDLALLRLCLAVMYSAIGRGFSCADDALDLWESVWNDGRLPYDRIEEYLDKWEDRFWLSHPDRPFYQRPYAVKGTPYDWTKLDGTLLQSNNKDRFYTEVLADKGGHMDFAHAARWLVHLIAFDDNSLKKSKDYKAAAKGGGPNDSAGTGWLGKCGPVYFDGGSLFKTLMLNFVLLDHKGEPYADGAPCWELDELHEVERMEIPVPGSPQELYTVQSRHIILNMDEDKGEVYGYSAVAGDIFASEDAFIEPMTIWRGEKKKGGVTYKPALHRPERGLWRTLPGLLGGGFGKSLSVQPGIVRWAGVLSGEGIISGIPVSVCIASLQYAGTGSYNVSGMFCDGAQCVMNVSALLDPAWRQAVISAVYDVASGLARCVWGLARSAACADGMDYGKDGKGPAAAFAARQEEAFYAMSGQEFLHWLEGLDPSSQDCSEKAQEFKSACIACARRMPDIILRDLSPAALFGRPGDQRSAASAVNKFHYDLRRIEEDGQ